MTDKEKAIKRMQAIDRYEKSDKAKARKRRYYLKNRERFLEYQRDYLKSREEETK